MAAGRRKRRRTDKRGGRCGGHGRTDMMMMNIDIFQANYKPWY